MDALEVIVDEGRPANAWRFFRLGHDLLALLDELSDVPVAWRVTDLYTGSARAIMAPPEDHPEYGAVLGDTYRSLVLVQGGGRLPDEWSPDAVSGARRLVDHAQRADGETDWVAPRLRLVSDTNPTARGVSLSSELGERLDSLQPSVRQMPGAVRGELVGLNVSRGNRASLRLPDKRIVRIAFETPLRDILKDALYQQVELRGVVKQDAAARIFRIRAEAVDVLPQPRLRWVDLFGMDPGFTGDKSTDEYLKAARGEA